jgi:pyruvate/2-oxoglutarate dehydrogenase complex dihydrolipoamide acyltransferase (E2) component
MVSPGPLIHAIQHLLATHWPHLARFGYEKGAAGWDAGMAKYHGVQERRRAQQEQSLGKLLSAHYPSIEQAAEELRRRQPHLTKEQAIVKATYDKFTENELQATHAARQAANALGLDLSQVEGSGPDGLITFADVQRSSSLGR